MDHEEAATTASVKAWRDSRNHSTRLQTSALLEVYLPPGGRRRPRTRMVERHHRRRDDFREMARPEAQAAPQPEPRLHLRRASTLRLRRHERHVLQRVQR